MLLSILIPIYNHDSSALIDELCRQARQLQTEWQLIAIEDGSKEHVGENKAVCHRNDVEHITLDKNIGRSAIRNLLASKACGEWLIFLDCDMIVENPDFVENYLNEAQKASNDTIICGGPTYWPFDKYEEKYRLHWTVGSHREPVSTRLQNKNCQMTLLSSNFMVRKETFDAVKFDETLTGYGHEDTLFGIEHIRKGGKFKYIDNAAIHTGLDETTRFIEKTKEALHNLMKLYNEKLDAQGKLSIKLITFAERLRKWHMMWIVRLSSYIALPIIECNLKSKHPSLFLFDIYKIMTIGRLYNRQ